MDIVLNYTFHEIDSPSGFSPLGYFIFYAENAEPPLTSTTYDNTSISIFLYIKSSIYSLL